MDVITIEENKAAIAKRGEMIFGAAITKNVEPQGVIFDPTFLGDKFPDVDFYVKLNGYNNKKAYFLAAVKITTRGFYDAGRTRIHITFERNKLKELVKFQVPVYLFGIDNNSEQVYILNGNKIGTDSNLNGLPIKHVLYADNLLKIHKEVAAFYDNTKEITKFTTIFK